MDPVFEFRTTRRVEFADTDMGGIVHFSRFVVFMETAEHEFLRSLGWDIHFHTEAGEVGWPRVECWCRYHRPARLGEELELHLRVLRKGTKSMTYETTFEYDGQLLARGRITSVCCLLDAPEGLRAIPIPTELAERIAQAPGPEEPQTEPTSQPAQQPPVQGTPS